MIYTGRILLGLSMTLWFILMIWVAMPSHGDYSAASITLVRLRAQERELTLHALQSRAGLLPNYDSLVENVRQVDALYAGLLHQTAGLRLPASWFTQIQRYGEQLRHKEEVIEDFKSRNAILQNSLHYLPQLSAVILDQVHQAGPDGILTAAIDELLRSVLLRAVLPDLDDDPGVERSLQRLAAVAAPAALSPDLRLLADYARNVAAQQRSVTLLLRELIDLSRSTAADELYNGLWLSRQSIATRRALIQLAAVVALALPVAAAAWLLRRTRRCARDLNLANETLELRVEQRTSELVDANQRLQLSLEQQKSTQRQLLEASRLAGMAEVATAVLHNVGNVLNSVNVSAELLIDGIKQSRLDSLVKGTRMLHDQPDLATFLLQDKRGKILPAYLHGMTAVLVNEQATFLKELELVQKNIDHIKTIVGLQQMHAKPIGVTERLNLTELLEDAIQLDRAEYTRQAIQVVRDFADLPMIILDRHRALQIIVNLLCNARHAVKDLPGKDRRITVRVREDPQAWAAIAVEDTGYGIPVENLSQIFNYRFTTKSDGHGIGLHSSACSAKAMGGSLSAHSEGLGRGAVFTLLLPLR